MNFRKRLIIHFSLYLIFQKNGNSFKLPKKNVKFLTQNYENIF